jgi:glycosyltransferase involved in cell wall biosynthesis
MPPPVHVLGRFPPPFDGQTLATELVATLLEPAFDVRRVNTQVPGENRVHERTFSVGRLRHYLGLRRRLRAALASEPEAPVLWHSISPLPLGHWRDVLTTLPAFGSRQPVYAVMHRATFERLFRSPLTAATASRVVSRVQAFVFQSRRLAEACAVGIPPEKVVLIPNTIDAAVMCSAAEVAEKHRAPRAPDRALRLLYASNMFPTKGYGDVLEAAISLSASGIPFEADFVGGWTDEADRIRFEARVRESGLGDRVRHHGAISDRARMRALHLAADVFLLPTYYPVETQPKAIIEALSAGTPVVATRRGIIEDMVQEGDSAHLVPPRDPAAIAAAVERLREPGHWQRLALGARARFEAAFSPEVVGAQWERLTRGEVPSPDGHRIGPAHVVPLEPANSRA